MAKNRPSSEWEQGLTRVFIATIVAVYLTHRLREDYVGEHAYALAAVGAYLVFSLALLFALSRQSANSAVRYLSLTSDLVMTTFAAHLGGELLAPFFPIYLWIILGHGIRYGERVLLVGALLGAAGFGTVIRINDYWLQNPAAGMGMFLTLVVIPLFVSMLVRKLERSKRLAEDASQAKSRFLANMSHEIRTPLTGIIGLSELLFEDAFNSRQKSHLREIHESANTLLVLLDDVLDLSKIEAGKLSLHEQGFNLRELVARVAVVLRRPADAKGIEVRTNLSRELAAKYVGDSTRIMQILLNLGSNAVKFTERGQVEISVSSEARSGATHVVRFEVSDTGIGIAPQLLPRIFEEFVQADETTTRTHGGSGLGTTISSRLVEILGGTLEVAGLSPHGSVFWFELPLAPETLPERAAPGQRGVVIASPDELLTASVSSAFESWGFQASVLDRNSTIDTLVDDSRLPDLLIVDERFADVRRILQESQTAARATPPILLLRNTDERLIGRNVHHLQRPFDKPRLFNAMHTALNGGSSQSGVSRLVDRISIGNSARRRVLVAEDNATNRNVIQLILERGGHSVSSVASGDAAIDALGSMQFDIAIVDYQMPDVGGLDVIKTHRFGSDPNGDIPIIVLTAHATKDIQSECEQAGADAFLTKPIDPIALLEVVDSLTSKQRAAEATSVTAIDTPGANGADAFDPRVLDYLFSAASSSEQIGSIMRGFITDSNADLVALEQSLARGDLEEFKQIAHALKGSAGSVGARLILLAAERGLQIDVASSPVAGRKVVEDLRTAISYTEVALRETEEALREAPRTQ